MALVARTLIRLSDHEMENENASKLYINVPKKVLQMYTLKVGCLLYGEIIQISKFIDENESLTPQIRTGPRNYSQIIGNKVKMIFYGGSSDEDQYYLFFPKSIAIKFTSYAVFPSDYIIKIRFDLISCGWKRRKLYSQTSVNFDDTEQYYE
jgi:hypothetical protein